MLLGECPQCGLSWDACLDVLLEEYPGPVDILVATLLRGCEALGGDGMRVVGAAFRHRVFGEAQGERRPR